MAEPIRRRGRPKKQTPDAPGTVQALDRALDLLDLLAAQPGLTLSEVAERVGPAALDRAPRPAHAGRARDGGKRSGDAGLEHRAGDLPAGLGLHAPLGLVERARPILRALMDHTGETANLGILDGDAVLFRRAGRNAGDDPRLLPARHPLAPARLGDRQGAAGLRCPRGPRRTGRARPGPLHRRPTLIDPEALQAIWPASAIAAFPLTTRNAAAACAASRPRSSICRARRSPGSRSAAPRTGSGTNMSRRWRGGGRRGGRAVRGDGRRPDAPEPPAVA